MRDPEHEALVRKVVDWSNRLKVRPKIIRVQRMTRKWGSCSSAGVITLASDLTHEEPGFQDYVIAHELLHLRVPSHGRVFAALMSAHLPGWRTHDLRRREGGGQG